MKFFNFKTKLCSLESTTSEQRRSFLKTSISLAVAGVTYSALPSIALANSLTRSCITSNLLKDNSIFYNGYIYDSPIMAYRLGKRHYNPFRKNFNTPDVLSPFGVAGPNRYQYADGDPINNVDPSGHLSGGAIALIVTIGVLTVLASIVTLGAAAIAFSGALTVGAIVTGSLLVTSAVTGLASGATSIASIAIEESQPELSAKLATAGIALGIISMVTGIGGFSMGLNSTATAGSFGQIFGSAARTSLASRPPIHQMVTSIRNTTMAGGLGDGLAALGQMVIGHMAKNGSTLLKLSAATAISGSTTISTDAIRRHHNNLNALRLNTINNGSQSQYKMP